MIKKGRARHPGLRGEDASRSKLTWKQINEMRRLWATGNRTQRSIANQFNTSSSQVCLIVNRKIWKSRTKKSKSKLGSINLDNGNGGLCHCGCGRPAPIRNGHAIHFIHGHYGKIQEGMHGKDNPSWKGGRYKSRGRWYSFAPGHPRAHKNHVLEHILIAEQMIGRLLLPGEVVHHDDEDPSNNAPGNLIVCENDTAHKQLHVRSRAFKACGHAEWMKCKFCKKYDDPKNLSMLRCPSSATPVVYHKACNAAHSRKRKQITASQ